MVAGLLHSSIHRTLVQACVRIVNLLLQHRAMVAKADVG